MTHTEKKHQNKNGHSRRLPEANKPEEIEITKTVKPWRQERRMNPLLKLDQIDASFVTLPKNSLQ